MHNRSNFAALSLLALAATSTPALARPGDWGAPGKHDDIGPVPHPFPERQAQPDRNRGGRITVNRFVAEDVAAQSLGHGTIAVISETEGQNYVPQGNRAAYEAAVIDQLVHAGYDTAQARPDGGQSAELRVMRTVLQGADAPHDPVSGEVGMSVGNRGTAYGMAVNVDLTKPLPPLVSTQLEARIRDRATGKVLWEGRAEVATREGDDKWGDQEIAARLAAALFDGFPTATDAYSGTRSVGE